MNYQPRKFGIEYKQFDHTQQSYMEMLRFTEERKKDGTLRVHAPVANGYIVGYISKETPTWRRWAPAAALIAAFTALGYVYGVHIEVSEPWQVAGIGFFFGCVCVGSSV
jgi:allophanate hydrolase subunit 1